MPRRNKLSLVGNLFETNAKQKPQPSKGYAFSTSSSHPSGRQQEVE